MGLVGKKPLKKQHHQYNKWLIPCTCGRKGFKTIEDLMAIMEESGRVFYADNAEQTKMAHRNVMVCMRYRCLGKFITYREFMNEAPMIPWATYLEEKREAITEGPRGESVLDPKIPRTEGAIDPDWRLRGTTIKKKKKKKFKRRTKAEMAAARAAEAEKQS